MMETIRILVIGESLGLTRDLLLPIRRRTGFQVLGPVPDESAAFELLTEALPDIIVVELDRLDGRGVAVVSEMRSQTQIRVMAATRRPAAPAVGDPVAPDTSDPAAPTAGDLAGE